MSAGILFLWMSYLGWMRRSIGFWVSRLALFAGVYAIGFVRAEPWRTALIEVLQATARPDAPH